MTPKRYPYSRKKEPILVRINPELMKTLTIDARCISHIMSKNRLIGIQLDDRTMTFR